MFALCQKLFDHLVGTSEQRRRHGDAQRLGGLQVDVQFDFSGLLDRQVGWLLALDAFRFPQPLCVEIQVLNFQFHSLGSLHWFCGRLKSILHGGRASNISRSMRSRVALFGSSPQPNPYVIPPSPAPQL
jgi:hypothetical protein